MNLWPTPTQNGNYNRKGLSPSSGDGLATKVKMWPTPATRDYKGARLPETMSASGRNPATNSLPDATEFQTDEIGRLNPDWVEHLMGYPAGWTDLSIVETPTGSELRE